jgi:hypothetical protein
MFVSYEDGLDSESEVRQYVLVFEVMVETVKLMTKD